MEEAEPLQSVARRKINPSATYRQDVQGCAASAPRARGFVPAHSRATPGSLLPPSALLTPQGPFCRALWGSLCREAAGVGSAEAGLLEGTGVQEHAGDAVTKVQLAVGSYGLVLHQLQVLGGQLQLQQTETTRSKRQLSGPWGGCFHVRAVGSSCSPVWRQSEGVTAFSAHLVGVSQLPSSVVLCISFCLLPCQECSI